MHGMPKLLTQEFSDLPFFWGLSEKDLKKLLDGAHQCMLKPGDPFLQIFAPHCFFLVLSGELAVCMQRQVPESSVPMPPGTWIGECRTSFDWIDRLSFLRPKRMKLGITAACTTTLLTVQELQVKALSLPGQVQLIKNLDALSHQFLERFVLHGVECQVRAERLHAQIASQLRKRNESYARSEIVRSILANFPKLPLFAGKMIAMLQNEHATAGDIVETAKIDPSLAGLILRVANSPYYNLPQKVTDFQHAVLLLGFNQLYHMLMDSGIQSIMPKTAEFHKLRFDSVMLSFISFEIALATSAEKPVTASTIGLLQCIGRSVLLLLKKQHPASALLIDGLDHGKLGAMLLKEWSIPEHICAAIEYQTTTEFSSPRSIPAACRMQTAILYLAQLCYQHLEGTDEQDMPTIFLADYQRLIGVSPQPVTDFVRTYVKPGMLKKSPIYPDNIRHFLGSVESRWN